MYTDKRALLKKSPFILKRNNEKIISIILPINLDIKKILWYSFQVRLDIASVFWGI